MEKSSIQDTIDDATFDFTMGDTEAAIAKLEGVVDKQPEAFEAWLALCEVYFSESRLDEALSAAERAHTLNPQDVHVNTSLSRIWVERGDKDKAEHYGAQARMLGWKDQLKEPPSAGIV